MITSLYAGILGIIYYFISTDTIKARRKNKISVGSGKNNEILHLVSAHNNFASYIPLLLILLYLLEQQNVYPWLLHLLAISFVAGRLFHYYAFKAEEMNFKGRVRGMVLTLFPLIILSVLNIFIFFRQFVL